jgi:hypothetical protein
VSRAQAGQWRWVGGRRGGRLVRYAAPLFRMELAEVTSEGWRVWFQIGDNDDPPDKSGLETESAGCLAADAALSVGDVKVPSLKVEICATWRVDEDGAYLERTSDAWLVACVLHGGWFAWGAPELTLAPIEGEETGDAGRDAVLEILALNGLTVKP